MRSIYYYYFFIAGGAGQTAVGDQTRGAQLLTNLITIRRGGGVNNGHYSCLIDCTGVPGAGGQGGPGPRHCYQESQREQGGRRTEVHQGHVSRDFRNFIGSS